MSAKSRRALLITLPSPPMADRDDVISQPGRLVPR